MLAWTRYLLSRTVPSLLTLAVLLSLAPQGMAMYATWEGNGHAYSFVPLACSPVCPTWSQAQEVAQQQPGIEGMVSYLATITSQEEQDFIQNVVLPPLTAAVNKNQVWIGGQQQPGNLPKAGWGWANSEVAPERWSYENWTPPDEPNDSGNIDERFLTMWAKYYKAGVDGIFRDMRGTWNDEREFANPAAQIIGLICEWSPPSAPEPATAALVALGLGLLALGRRRTG